MKKQTKSLLISLSSLIVLGGIFLSVRFLLPNIKDSTIESDVTSVSSINQEKLLPDGLGELSSINIKNENDNFTVNVEKKDDKKELFSLVKNNKETVNPDLVEQSIVKNLVAELTGIVPIRTVEEDCSDLSKYGLNKSSVKVTLNFENNKCKTFILGNEAPLSVGYYLKDTDFNNKVYLITEPCAESFLFSTGDLITKAKEG